MFDEFLLYDTPNDSSKEFLHRVLDIGIDFIDGKNREKPALDYLDIMQLKSILVNDMPYESSDYDYLIDELNKIAKYSIPQSSERYLAFPDCGNSVAGLAADILKPFLNQNLIAIDRSAPIATFIEMQVILWLREMVGYKCPKIRDITNLSELGGMWTSGGNMSNYIAVLTALQYKFPLVKKQGINALEKKPVMIICEGMEHYSFLGAAQALGIGSEGIKWVKANDDFTSSAENIRQCIESLSANEEAFMVVAVAGNCRTSNIDNLSNIQKVCSENNIWFHVDACHGGSLLFSKELAGVLKGIELSDSVSLDPHKGLFVTYSSSYILFNKPECMGLYCRYPEKTYDPECFDLGLITPFYGSRGFDSLKLWLLIRHVGLRKLSDMIESRNSLYIKIHNILNRMGYFKFFNKPGMYRSAFVFYPKSIEKLVKDSAIPEQNVIDMINKYTSIFANSLYEKGEIIFDLFKLADLSNCVGYGQQKYNVIGMSIGHPYIKELTLKQIENTIKIESHRLIFEMEISIKNIILGKIGDKVDETNMSPASW